MSQSTTPVLASDARLSLYRKLKSGDVKLVLFLLVGQFAKLDEVRRDVARSARRWLFAGTKGQDSLVGGARRMLRSEGVESSAWTNERLASEIAAVLWQQPAATECECSNDNGPCHLHNGDDAE